MALRNSSKYLLSLLLVISFVQSSYANQSGHSKSTVKFLSGSNVPDDIIFFDEDQNQYSLDQFEGKTILLVFWATWCAPCTKEMPYLDTLQKDFRKLPFSVIPISEDYQGAKIIQEYYKNYQIRYLPIYYDYKNLLFKSFSIIGLPTSILIDPDGKMVASFIGHTNWYDDEIRKIILSAIPGNNPEPKNSYNEQSLNQPAKPLKPVNKAIVKDLLNQPEPTELPNKSL